MKIENAYPLTVIADRYNGTYSGGKYIAFNDYPDEIPYDVYGGSDTECADFWANSTNKMIGIGNTPDEAIKNLVAKMEVVFEKVTEREIKAKLDMMSPESRTRIRLYLDQL